MSAVSAEFGILDVLRDSQRRGTYNERPVLLLQIPKLGSISTEHKKGALQM